MATATNGTNATKEPLTKDDVSAKAGEPDLLRGPLHALGAGQLEGLRHRLQPRTARAGQALTEIQRESALWIYSMFFYGEDAVTDGLSPYIDAAPKEEQKYFLATQQVDEARHSVFFHRFFKEVIGAGDTPLGRPRLHRAVPRLGLQGRLRPARDDVRRAAPRPLAAQVRAGDHALPPDHRGLDGPAGPALHRGLLHQGRDDARLLRGHAQRRARRAAPHRLRRQGPLRAARGVRRVQGRRRARS